MFAALKVLHCAAYTTRNWGLDDTIDRRQIYDLWEAVHDIPDLLTRWDADSERLLHLYFREYTDKWKNPDLPFYYQSFLPDNEKS